ncbi:unnamed protein product [Bursaphelenchus xylophilus]|uniref:(pine wood nematode) hypothetical protein n=1 Tax=Bursaphelenchus xylophilus TaxID=6326 RepID=A0A1I7RSI1_BURXY|nr:unnamed protein product [Bursaphelenchus xylophilus]CAG9122928.1 unnamed protein product [Bursaphelenchus xylophilus]
MNTIILLASLLPLTLAFPPLTNDVNKLATCPFPNQTDTKFYTYNCDGTMQIQVRSAAVYDRLSNKEIYPVNVTVPLLIKLKSVNNGVAINSNKVDVELAQYSSSWTDSNCKWHSIPTFGLLKNIDGCEFANNCPLQSGDLDLLLPLDLSKYSKILKLLTGDKAYQLRILMKDGEDATKKISCVVAQLKFSN